MRITLDRTETITAREVLAQERREALDSGERAHARILDQLVGKLGGVRIVDEDPR